MMPIIRLLRPHQYIKNGFVLVGIIFSHHWNLTTFISALIAFVAFCAMSSAVYVMNDIFDADVDKQHPEKKNRPIACGIISKQLGWYLFTFLILFSSVLGYFSGKLVPAILITYLLLNIIYSWHLKHIVILDIFVISTGFMLRLLAGTVGLGIEPSHWLLLCSFMLTLFLGFTKRSAELLLLGTNSINDNNGQNTRPVLDEYNPIVLEQYTAVSAACTILSYGLYAVSAAERGIENMIYTVPFVVYGIFRYLFLVHRKEQGNDTARDILMDRHLLLTVFGWLLTCIIILS